jgi:hypothetical protein
VDEYEELVGQHRTFEDDGAAKKWRERTLQAKVKGNKTLSWPEIGEHPRFFVFRSLGKGNIFSAMKAWLPVARKDNGGEWINAPFYSPIHPNTWYETNPRTGRKYRRKSVPECPIGALLGTAQQEVIGRDYNNERPSVDHVYYLEAFEVELEWTFNPESKKWSTKQDPLKAGWPKMVVNPKAFILEFRPQMFLSLKDKVLVPKASEVGGDDMTSDGPVLVLPTTDPTQVLVKFQKLKKTVNPTGDAAKDVLYDLSFSDKFTFDSKSIQEVEPLPRTPEGLIDWPAIFPAVTKQEVDNIVATYFGGLAPAAGSAPAGGQGGQDGPPPSDGPPPTSDDDIPF